MPPAHRSISILMQAQRKQSSEALAAQAPIAHMAQVAGYTMISGTSCQDHLFAGEYSSNPARHEEQQNIGAATNPLDSQLPTSRPDCRGTPLNSDQLISWHSAASESIGTNSVGLRLIGVIARAT